MNFHILTLFPEMIMNGLGTSITGRAMANGLLSIEAVNIRDYAFNKHNSVDDYPYGGGAGMLMQAEPVYIKLTKPLKSRFRLENKGQKDKRKSYVLFICLLKEVHLHKIWQKNWPRKKI